jgi:hypothetical protein
MEKTTGKPLTHALQPTKDTWPVLALILQTKRRSSGDVDHHPGGHWPRWRLPTLALGSGKRCFQVTNLPLPVLHTLRPKRRLATAG